MYTVVGEAKDSLALAFKAVEEGRYSEQSLYLFASQLYSEKYNIKDEELVRKMSQANELQILRDYSFNEGSKRCYKFHFISSYFYCFVVAGTMSEWEYDGIIELLCTELGLFIEDACYLNA